MSCPINTLSASTSRSLESRLNAYPELKAKIESLLAVVENAEGDLNSAHEAEQRVVEEIQKLGQLALQGWAIRENEQQRETFVGTKAQVHLNKKNTLLV